MTTGEFWANFVCYAVVCFTCSIIATAIRREKNRSRKTTEAWKPAPFIVSEYLERMEKAGIEVLENREPIERTIILWWGLDGLRLNEDGMLEWISRKKPEPVNQDVFYQTPQWIAPLGIAPLGWHPYGVNMFQNTQAQINCLAAQNTCLKMQAAQIAQNAQIMNCINAQCYPQNVLFH